MLTAQICARPAAKLGTRISGWMRYTLLLFTTICLAQKSYGGNTIHVTTPFEGVSSGGCSLQEAIYSAEFGTNIALRQTDPDTAYATTCEPGTGDGDTIILKAGEVYSFDTLWDGDSHNYMGPT